MNTDEYAHRLLLLTHTMINLLTASGCNGKRKTDFFPDTALFFSLFSMVLRGLQEISKSTITLPPS